MHCFQTLTLLAQQPLLAQEATVSPIEELDPPVKAALLMALLGIILLGFFMVLVIMLGARWVRRLGTNDLKTRQPLTAPKKEASRKSSNNDRRALLDDLVVEDQETLVDGARAHDTSVDENPQ